MLTFIMDLIADMIEKPVQAGPSKEYAFVFDYWDMWENEVNVKTDGRNTMTPPATVFDSDLLDWEAQGYC